VAHSQQVPTARRGRSISTDALETQRHLAGCVAHDLNNYLTAILGYGELLEDRFADDESASRFLRELLQASGRAQDFSRQLQAFSGRLVMDPQRADLNELLFDVEDELLDILGPGIDLRIETDNRLPDVEVDVRHVKAMLRWLAEDALGAMGSKGELCIGTRALSNSVDQAPSVLLVSEDSGTPPEEADRRRYFEPFRKAPGLPKGLARTGVAGVAQHHGGRAEMEAREEGGRRIRIVLPAAS